MTQNFPQSSIEYREAQRADVPLMARIWEFERGEGGTSEERMTAYFDGRHHPQQALALRVIYVAFAGDALIGYVAGHLTRRFRSDGELQWIYVSPEWRRKGVASELLRSLALWFEQQQAARVCVNVAASNTVARSFYARGGAGVMDQYWLVWEDIEVAVRNRR